MLALSTWAMVSRPASLSDFSSTVTLCPRSAATRAASRPPGPAPTTAMCCFSVAGLSWGRPTSTPSHTFAFTEHWQGLPMKMLSRQREHTMQGRTCSGRPSSTLRAVSGSAMNWRAMPTASP